MGDIPVAGGVDVQVEEVIEEVVDKEVGEILFFWKLDKIINKLLFNRVRKILL